MPGGGRDPDHKFIAIFYFAHAMKTDHYDRTPDAQRARLSSTWWCLLYSFTLHNLNVRACARIQDETRTHARSRLSNKRVNWHNRCARSSTQATREPRHRSQPATAVVFVFFFFSYISWRFQFVAYTEKPHRTEQQTVTADPTTTLLLPSPHLLLLLLLLLRLVSQFPFLSVRTTIQCARQFSAHDHVSREFSVGPNRARTESTGGCIYSQTVGHGRTKVYLRV